MIEGVTIIPLPKFCNDQGCVYKMLSENDPFFRHFGEIYFSSILPGVIKGWNLHTRIDANIACVSGDVRLVLYDRRSDSISSKTIQEVVIGEENYCLVQIPHGVAYSWQALGDKQALIGNCATASHDPQESIKIALASGEIPYQWK